MNKKPIRFIVSFFLLLGLIMPAQTFASNKVITIVIDGKEISADQPPVVEGGRTLVPLRAIFEGLQATVDFNSVTKTITAKRGNVTIVLTLGSKNAVINNKTVQLDVPAQVLKNRTLVPVRFVGEALGDDVVYNDSTKKVEIKTKNNAVSNIVIKDISDWGDGRDLQVNFTAANNQTAIDHYRAIIVKNSKFDSFNVNNSFNLPANRYSVISKAGTTIERVFQSSTLDTDGELIQNDVDYRLVIISMNKGNRVLAYESAKFTISTTWKVSAVSNLRLKDASDFGDGRDLEISFNKIADETNLLHYRAIVVRSDEANTFNLSAAKEVSSSNYTTITKTGENIKQILSSWTRDNQGRLLQTGVAYKVFILSVANDSRSYSSSLSAASNAITLGSNPEEIRVTKLTVKDTYDYGDGRDLQVSFTAPTNDTRVSEYRVFVVREADVSKFNLAKAESISSNNYTRVTKSSSADITVNLASGARDIDGYYLQSDIAYRVFVLSVGNQANSYKNSLSTASASIKLTNNQIAAAVTGLSVKDISDWGDGRDIEVSFNKVSDETKVSEYRVIVVKSVQASGFTLSSANTTNNYTTFPKANANLKRTLLSTTKDAFGDAIREDVEYKVFVLSVSVGGNNGNNALSTASPTIKLTKNTAALAVTGVTASDSGDSGDGSDLVVSFNKITDETRISEYRIMVVKSGNAFDLIKANSIISGNYTKVGKDGKNKVQRLDARSKDTDGDLIVPDQVYNVYVLSVSNTGNSNALSSPSAPVSISNTQVKAVSNIVVKDVSNNGNGTDLEITFNSADPETNISYYEVFVVREADRANFNITTANSMASDRRTRIEKSGDPVQVTLKPETKDTAGHNIQNGVAYYIYVLSVADGAKAAKNALSNPSGKITLTSN